MQLLADAIPRAVTELLRDAPTSPGKVLFAWKAAVGPAMDRVTAVRQEGATLLVDVQTAAWGQEVRRSSHVILRRMEGLLGADVPKMLLVRPRT